MERQMMSREEMINGLKAGRTAIQEEWSNPKEIKMVDDLVSEGIAHATDWKYRDNFQCEMRRVTKAQNAKNPASIASG